MILIALFMLLVIIFSVSDIESLFIPMTKVRVWFHEVRGLKVNDPVLYAGVNVGRVASLKVEEGKDGEPPKVVLTLEIESRYRLRQDAVVRVGKTFTGKTSIQIRPGKGAPLPKNALIAGQQTPELADFAALTRPIVQKVDQTLSRLNDMFGDEQRANVRAFIGDLRCFVEKLKEVSENLDALTENRGEVKASLHSIREAADSAKKFLDSHSDQVGELLVSLKEAADEAKKSLAEAGETAKTARAMLLKAETSLGKVNEMLDVNAADVKTTVANVRDAAASLRAWADDVKRHPWKVVRKSSPPKGEKEISMAAQDLDRILARLDASLEMLLVVTQTPNTAVKQELGDIRQMIQQVKESASTIHAAAEKIKKK